MKNIGIIGLGIMGFNSAKYLLNNQYNVSGYDPFEKATKKAEEAGVTICSSPAQLASKVDIILLLVPGPKESREALLGDHGVLEQATKGLLIGNMSTVDPASNVKLSEELAARGVVLIDTPVLGLPAGVGNWSFLVGGSSEAYERIKPVLSCLSGSGDKVFHAGNVGDGNKIKLLNNLMFGAITSCTAEIMALAKHMGVSQKMLLDAPVAANAGTVSNLYKAVAKRVIDDNYSDPFFTVKLLKKDNALALEMAKAYEVPLVLAEAINTMNEMACTAGLANGDISAMWKMIEHKRQ